MLYLFCTSSREMETLYSWEEFRALEMMDRGDIFALEWTTFYIRPSDRLVAQSWNVNTHKAEAGELCCVMIFLYTVKTRLCQGTF